jgi:N-acetylmuramoyl-L-alanine amidase
MKRNPTHRSRFNKLAATAALLTPLAAALTVQAQPDYGPAIWRPVYSGHWYTSGNGHRFVVIHDMEGYYLSTISYFQQSGTQASIHYYVNGVKDSSSDAPAGEISQGVREAYYAWHALCWNTYSAGTEHEGFASNPAWYTEAMYQASAGLQRHLCDGYGIAKDRNHIVAHGQKSVPGWSAWAGPNLGIDPNCNTHTDPGPNWDWNHFMALINTSSSNPHVNPVIGVNSDGRQEIFIVGKTGALYHSYQTAINAGWSGWISLGGTWAQNVTPAVGRNSDGRLEVFIIGTTGEMYHAYEGTAGNSTSWSGWASLSGSWTQTASVATGMNASGAMEVFVIGPDGQLNHNYQSGPGSWSGWIAMGGNWSQNAALATGNDQDGRQEVFAIGNTGNLYHIYQTTVNGSWSGFASLGGTFAQDARTALTRNSDGRLEIFIISTGGDLVHSYQTTPNGGWYGWPSLGGQWAQNSKPVAAANLNGNLEVMVIGNTGNFYHNYQSGGAWSGWVNLNGTFSQDIRPAIGRNQDGRLEVFLTGQGSDILHGYENSPNSTSWTTWPSLGGSWN